MIYSDTEVDSNETVTSIDNDTTENVDIHSLTDRSVFNTDEPAFVLSGVTAGFSSWNTKIGKSKLDSLRGCKTGVYLGLKKDLFNATSNSDILSEFKNRYEELVILADKVGSGDLNTRFNDLFSTKEQIGNFIADESRNTENLSRNDWWVLCYPFRNKDVYDTIELKIQEFNTLNSGKPYAMAEMNQSAGSNGTQRTNFSNYIARAELPELEEMMREIHHQTSMRHYERIIKNEIK